jgi:hypothetical protein
MQKIIFSLLALSLVYLPMKMNAQTTTDDLFNKYGAAQGFTSVNVSSELFSLFAQIAEESDDAEVRELNKMIRELEQIRILMFNQNEAAAGENIEDFKKELSNLKLKDFTELMTVREADQTFRFMIQKDGKIIRELLLLIDQPSETGFISITGNIDLKTIAKLSRTMNIQGLEKLEQLEKE